MNNIQLRYGSGRTLQFQTPSKWNELNLQQLLFIIKTHSDMVNPDAGADELKLQVQQYLMKVTIYLMKEHLPASMRRLTGSEIIDLARHHHFLTEECSLFRQLIPSVSVGNHTFFGPDDALSNAVFIEFLEANSTLLKFIKSKNNADLDKFIAILYRPAKSGFKKGSLADNGDCRIPYHKPSLEDFRTKIISKLKPELKRAIQLWFTGCCKHLQSLFPEAFDPGSRQSEFGIHGIIDSLAGSKWGRPENVEQTLLYRILISICRTSRIIEEAEA